jgi:hypothetical protein
MGLGGIADIGAECGDLVTFLGQLRDEYVGRGLIGEVVDRDRRAIAAPILRLPPVTSALLPISRACSVMSPSFVVDE